MTYRKILNMGLDQIQSMKYNDLRKALSELNKEANRRLEVWKRNTRKTLEPPIEIEKMIKSGEWFKQRQKMTKKELLRELQQRQKLLTMKTSTVWGARKARKNLLDRLRSFFEENGFDSDNVDTKYYNLFEKLLSRLRDSGILSHLSREEYLEAVKYVREITRGRDIEDIDELYEEAVNYIDEQFLRHQQKRAREDSAFRRGKFRP